MNLFKRTALLGLVVFGFMMVDLLIKMIPLTNFLYFIPLSCLALVALAVVLLLKDTDGQSRNKESTMS